MPRIQKIAPSLWFDDQAEDAAKDYTGNFENSRIVAITHFGKAGFEVHHQPEGKVLTVYCDTQKEIDYFWEKLRPADGGGTRV
jgi:predicted 3-demethylubiquinone-9 3-methyltransferase (glyoxalase superfamily)